MGERIKFPCPEDGKYATLDQCSECSESTNCDVYLTMLDEDFD